MPSLTATYQISGKGKDYDELKSNRPSPRPGEMVLPGQFTTNLVSTTNVNRGSGHLFIGLNMLSFLQSILCIAIIIIMIAIVHQDRSEMIIPRDANKEHIKFMVLHVHVILISIWTVYLFCSSLFGIASGEKRMGLFLFHFLLNILQTVIHFGGATGAFLVVAIFRQHKHLKVIEKILQGSYENSWVTEGGHQTWLENVTALAFWQIMILAVIGIIGVAKVILHVKKLGQLLNHTQKQKTTDMFSRT